MKPVSETDTGFFTFMAFFSMGKICVLNKRKVYQSTFLFTTLLSL
jgi:hypothetical protein